MDYTLHDLAEGDERLCHWFIDVLGAGEMARWRRASAALTEVSTSQHLQAALNHL